MAGPKFFPAGESRVLDIVGDQVQIRLSGADTGGVHALIEEVSPPEGGTPPHTHSHEDETFYVVQGEYEFLVGGRTVRLGPGGVAYGPRGIQHCFRNVGKSDARLLIVISPAGLEEFFEEADEMTHSGPASVEELAELVGKYGLEIPAPSA